MQLNHIKIKSNKMKNMGFRMMATMSWKRQRDGRGERETVWLEIGYVLIAALLCMTRSLQNK